MAVAAEHAGHAGAMHDDLAPRTRLQANRFGLWLFIASESFLFAALIASRYYLLGFETSEDLNQPLGLAITMILLVSSLTAYMAEESIATNDQRRFLRFTWLTVLLAVVFVGGVAYEWSEAFAHFPPGTLFGTLFFAITGLHAFHVITGAIALAAVGWVGRDARWCDEDHWPVEGVVKYWHFVDVVWVFIFPTLYLLQ
jgi:cytochrome c oxidase subunit 3